MRHVLLERHAGLMTALCLLTMSLGALAQLVPLGAHPDLARAPQEIEPLSALALEGQRIYRREGCQQCHTRMVRDLPGDTARYGAPTPSQARYYDRPSLWGVERRGPDLSKLPAQHDDAWQRLHLHDPPRQVPGSAMPAYPWLFERTVSGERIAARMRALQDLGVPYENDEILAAPNDVRGTAEITALLAYLQQAGTASAIASRGP